jgi:methyl-accepting chemotaxis protein
MLTVLLVAALATLAVQYEMSDREVGTEFFRAHKTIAHTGELLQRGLLVGVIVLILSVAAIGLWALRLTHRIVAPVHTLRRALDAMMTGDLGVRVALHAGDEFQEVGASLNRLAEEFAATLARVHTLADTIDAQAAEVAREAGDASAERRLHALTRELDRTLEFFRLQPRRTIHEDDTTTTPDVRRTR